MKISGTILLCMLSSIVSCLPSDTLYFQPATAMRSTASKFYEEVKYIPLETNHKSLFGKIKKLVVSDYNFIIWDDETNSIYFFDKQGKFIRKYRPPKCIIKDIQLNKKRNALFITGSNKNYKFSDTEIEKMMEDPTNTRFSRFSWSGYYSLDDVSKGIVHEIKNFNLALTIPFSYDSSEWAFGYINADRKGRGTTDYELKIYRDNTLLNQYYPYDKGDALYYLQPQRINFYPGPENSLLFSRPYQYSIYKLEDNKATNLYTIVLPADNSIPQSFFAFSFRSKGEVKNYQSTNRGLVWQFENLYQLGRQFYFSLNYRKSQNEKNFMYDAATKRFYNTGRVSADSSNCFLPLIAEILYSDGQNIYGSVSSRVMFSAMERNISRNPDYRESLSAYFDNSSADANPVIIEARPKRYLE